ncbi:MAG: BON domain-containing protein [Microcoleus sp. PH2017_10_PVI_O_A]|uniref:OmpA family protein n=1 Tax=unclassified Microcoleus TaxID=2642155 RepID=UPI001D290894|nr:MULTISPECIES: BON domain-containing protein [unclassified Microcoleus]TAE82656.1 MAG: BON domain-containing protein [Oscillatoriales cyanobacterium]MCC3404424.1 BON domain-containing protein [Microcoleus sp. PH2017_10_PVI_O_A]MCC3458512.1 BON domain-containing protein [Microcoleus sp. PH2017_11_PCY_U_A]MCC3477230.1 BON domain-containing protein [Microcoleus sp. PH2017_12_PCY_D_A]MCC3529912.1 BON domain-containing protein [Microcoleus sp. PH2017_21_RUC_O_A]
MAASNDNSGNLYQSETEVSDAILASRKAGDQLQELLIILTEMQLLKQSRKEPIELKLPPSQKSADRLEEEETRRNQLSFLIESPAVVPEVLKDREEIPSYRRRNKNDEAGLSKIADLENNYRPSDEELEQAVEEFKRLQKLLFERDLPEFYSNIFSVEQRLENFEKLMSEPKELMNLLKPLIPELVREDLERLKFQLNNAIELASNDKMNRLEVQAKLADLENQISDFNQQQLGNSEQLVKRLMLMVGDLLNRKVEESKLEVTSAIAPTINQVIDNQSALEEQVVIIEEKLATVQQRSQQQPEDIIKQLLPVVSDLLARKISELKLEVVETLAPSVQVRIAWVEIEEKVLSIVERRLATQESPIQTPEEIMAVLMPAIADLLNRKIDESKLEVAAAIEPLIESAILQREVPGKLSDVESRLNNLQRQQKSQPEEIMARLMPLMIDSLNRKIDETKLEVREAIAPAVDTAIQNSGIAAQILQNESKIVEVQQQVLGEIEGLMGRIMPAILELLSGSIRDAKLEIESAIAPAVDAIVQNKRIEERLGQIEQKIVAIEHRIYQSTDLFTDLLKPLIDELMVSHHSQLEKSVIQSILPLLDEVVGYNYNLNGKVQELDRKITDAEWGGAREEVVARIKLLFPGLMIQTINECKKSFAETLAPIIDEVINTKARENRHSMGVAISPALPVGISHSISESPDEIAMAIAPEMALAIKQQIALKQEAMSDALYPIIGSTILKYMAETMREINEKLESSLSPEGISRKIKAKLQGISEAELLMQETTALTVKAVFLIHAQSGLVISAVQQSEREQLESEMVAGMLTAIRSFVNDCILQSGNIAEIDAIEYGTSTIVLEVAGSCYLAVVMQGEIRQWFKYKMRAIFKNIIQEYGDKIQAFNGDPTMVPAEVNLNLQKLMNTEPKVKSPKLPIVPIIGLAALGLIGVPWGIHQYRSGIAATLEADTNLALQSAPELSVYRLAADVKDKVLEISGRVPNQKLRSKAEKIAQQAAPNLRIDNKIIAVEVPPDPVLAEADVKRTLALLNKLESINISARYAEGKVAVAGSVSKATDAQKITQAFEKIPGVKSVTNTVGIGTQPPSPPIEVRFYFGAGSAILSPKDIAQKLSKVKEYMEENSTTNLRVIGYSDFKSSPAENQKLALERATNVKAALVKEGINGNRIQVASTKGRPEGVEVNQPLWMSRLVVFEVVN